MKQLICAKPGANIVVVAHYVFLYRMFDLCGLPSKSSEVLTDGDCHGNSMQAHFKNCQVRMVGHSDFLSHTEAMVKSPLSTDASTTFCPITGMVVVTSEPTLPSEKGVCIRKASLIYLDAAGKIMLARNHGVEDKFYLPGGKIEEGETGKSTLLREIQEEC